MVNVADDLTLGVESGAVGAEALVMVPLGVPALPRGHATALASDAAHAYLTNTHE